MGAGKFSCDGCSKSYTWKPELANKRVKCKCGHALTVPADDPAAEALPPDFEDLYALAEGTPVEAALTPPPFSRGGATCPSCKASVDTDAVICVSCGTNLKTGKKLKTKAVKAGAAEGATSGGAAVGGLGYAGMSGRQRAQAAEKRDVFFHPVKDLYIPAGLIVLGTVLSYVALVYHHGVRNPGAAIFAVGMMTLINLVLTIPGILLTIKLFDLGLGPIG